MSRSARLGLLLLLPFTMAIVAFVLAGQYVEGRFVQWVPLGRPPEPAQSLTLADNGLWALAASGQYYRHRPDEAFSRCSDQCWQPEASGPSALTRWSVIPLEACVSLPSLSNVVTAVALCELWGVGSSLSVYALRDDGTIHYWEHGIDEGMSMVGYYSPFIGALAGLVLAVIVLLVSGFNRLLDVLVARAAAKANTTS